MGTITEPTDVMWDIVDAHEAEFPTAVFSGINGDAAHQTKPGKHLSRSQNKDKFGSNCWPLEAPNDQKGPTDKAIAIDISMSRTDQNRCHGNLRKIYNNRANDPRAKYLYAFNGWDGQGSPGRYNLYKGTIGTADSSHEWHEHEEGYYAFVNDPEFARAIASAIRGETIEEYTGEDDMTRDELFLALDDYFLSRINAKDTAEQKIVQVRNALRAVMWQYVGGGIPAGKSTLGTLAGAHDYSMVVAEGLDEVPQEVIDQIEQAAREGAEAGAADTQAIADAVVAAINANGEGLTDAQEADVRNAVSEVLTGGTDAAMNPPA